VRREAARFTDQESCRMQRRAAVERCRKARRTLYVGVRLITTVIRIMTGALRVDTTRVTNDEQLIARVEALVACASAHADAMTQYGLAPGIVQRIANELAAFKMAKDAVTLAVAQFTEAAEAFDRAHEDARTAILILEGLLATSDDAPVGALTSLRSAKRIGPRVNESEQAAQSAAPAGSDTPQPQPRVVTPFAPVALARALTPRVAAESDDALHYGDGTSG